MIRVSSIPWNHPLLREVIPYERFPVSARKLLKHCGDADGGVLAWDGKRMVGFFRYFRECEGTVNASGTWVDPAYRRRGIAKKMWNRLIARRPSRVEVSTYTRGGRALVESIRRSAGSGAVIDARHR